MSQEVVEVMQAVKYHSYPEYTNTGLTWLGAIPKHWGLKRAKFVFKRVQRPVRVEDDIVTAFRDGQVTLRSNRRTEGFTNALQEIGYQGVRSGDLLIHAMDGFAGAIGISDSEGKCSPVCSVCIPISAESVNPYYYGYLVRQLAVTGFITSLSKGIRERSTEFRFSEFSPLELALPPVDEQHIIAAFLDYETARIDRLIAQQQRLIELLKEKRQAVISHAVTKGLNPDAPMKDSGVEWIGQVPEHWVISPLKYKCVFSGGGTPSKDNLEYWNGSIPWVSPKDMKSFWITDAEDKITEQAIKESSTKLVQPGAVLMVVRSGILQRTIPVGMNTIPVTMNQDMKAIRFSSDVYAEWLSFFIKGYEDSLLLDWRKQGATVESIEHEYLANSLMLFPPEEEARSIIAALGRRLDKFDQLEQRASDAITLLQERRTALISAAVTGKIDLRGWTQPAEEVAA
ncbi:restriction endonuclease subunit S [Aeromonas veronii]|uniref:restriction endonuclease subunit S n=1 Tax=Aeromonas veronii TaxID=654 RepID=UPI002443C66A|nr:restriction endonuclease subunit S [Aeromonas veronii]